MSPKKPFFAPLSEEAAKALYQLHYKTAIESHGSATTIRALPPGRTDGDHENPPDSGYYVLWCIECDQRLFIEGSPSTAYGYCHGNLQTHQPCTRTKAATSPMVKIISRGGG